MEATTLQGAVRRIECSVQAGEILPGEPFDISLRVVAPPPGATIQRAAFYCIPGGQMDLTYFDLGQGDDRRFSLAEALARRGFVVMLADHPGIGKSTLPRDEWELTPDLLAKVHVAAAVAAMSRLREGSLLDYLAPMPDLVPIGLGHSMGAVVTIDMQGGERPYAGLVLLGYGTGGLPDILPPDAVDKARDLDWLRSYLPQLVRERFGTALLDPQVAKAKRRGRAGGSPSFHTDSADPDGKAALRGAAAPLLTLPGLFSMFPGVSDRASAAIDVPILVVTGANDFVEAGEQLHSQFPACPALDIFRPADTGHNLFIFPSRKESFARIADWAEHFART